MRQTISDLIYKASYSLLIALLIVPFISLFFIKNNFIPLGRQFGEWAIRFLWITMLPGILKRFGVTGYLQNIQIILMRSRRRLGDITFMLALNHFLLVQGFSYLRHGIPKLTSIPLFEYMGIIGLSLLLPLFVTSNNYSVRTLKIYWQKIHNLVYVAIWFIALHTLLNGKTLQGIITVGVALLQILSWIIYKRRQQMVIASSTT